MCKGPARPAALRDSVARLALILQERAKWRMPLPLSVWRRKPSARHPGRAGNHFRGDGVREGPSRDLSKVAGLVTEDAAKAFVLGQAWSLVRYRRAGAFRSDVPNGEVHVLDAGHFGA